MGVRLAGVYGACRGRCGGARCAYRTLGQLSGFRESNKIRKEGALEEMGLSLAWVVETLNATVDKELDALPVDMKA